MKQIIWIYGKKGSGKHQFCKEIASQATQNISFINEIKNYQEFNKNIPQEITTLKLLAPEICASDDCINIFKDFKLSENAFSNERCNTLFITTWYNPIKYYELSKFNNPTPICSEKDFLKSITQIVNLQSVNNKDLLKSDIISKIKK